MCWQRVISLSLFTYMMRRSGDGLGFKMPKTFSRVQSLKSYVRFKLRICFTFSTIRLGSSVEAGEARDGGSFGVCHLDPATCPGHPVCLGHVGSLFLRATSHTRLRARDHYASNTLIGGKGGAGPSSLRTALEGPTEYIRPVPHRRQAHGMEACDWPWQGPIYAIAGS